MGDYFPEDFDKDAQPGFTDGIMGSTGLDKMKAMNQGQNNGPGVDILGGIDALTYGGLQQNPDVPDGVVFEAGPRFDEEVVLANVPSTGSIETDLAVKPVCMTFEDFYCGWTAHGPAQRRTDGADDQVHAERRERRPDGHALHGPARRRRAVHFQGFGKSGLSDLRGRQEFSEREAPGPCIMITSETFGPIWCPARASLQ